MAVDLVIRGGTVLDGSGSEPYRADVVIGDGRIIEIGAVGQTDAAELDATGLSVAPGFIDIHSHSDYTLLIDPRADERDLSRGDAGGHRQLRLRLLPDRRYAARGNAIYGFDEAIPLTWQGIGGYLEKLEAAGPAINVMSLMPNGQLRLSILGLQDEPRRPPNSTRCADLWGRLDEGACGFSTGLEYRPRRVPPRRRSRRLRRDRGEPDASLRRIRAYRADLAPARSRRPFEPQRAPSAASRYPSDPAQCDQEEGSRCAARRGRRPRRGRYRLRHAHAAVRFHVSLAALPPGPSKRGPERATAVSLSDRQPAQDEAPSEAIVSVGQDWGQVVLFDIFWPRRRPPRLATSPPTRPGADRTTVSISSSPTPVRCSG